MDNAVQDGVPVRKRAFSTLGCAEFDLPATLALAARHGLDAIEIRAMGGTVDLATYFEAAYGTPARLASVLANSPVRVCALDTSLRLIGATPESREAFLRYVPWAEAAGVPALRVFDGGVSGDAAEIEQALATLAWWQERARHEGWSVDVEIETHDAFADVDALARFLEAAPNCQLLWDSHHTWRKGGCNPVEVWKLVQLHTRHIHVKDSIAKPSDRFPYSYVLPGAGEFPMTKLLQALDESSYDGIISLEWERLWHPDLPPLEDALAYAAQTGWWPAALSV
jgi:sugar phosphate isomerase/epimerase